MKWGVETILVTKFPEADFRTAMSWVVAVARNSGRPKRPGTDRRSWRESSGVPALDF